MKSVVLAISFMIFGTYASAEVVVKPSETKGPIKIMNAVNNGPIYNRNDQASDNFQVYKDCGIPFARTHDSNINYKYGAPHTVDITAVFPDFSKDVNNPDSYDFTLTDAYLDVTRKAGTDIFYRLGQRIEHEIKKYGIYPPADFQKWAEICEHIIRHYNEGWANGYHWNIIYWEIWNEADLDWYSGQWNTNPRTWGGTQEEFFKFYEVAANHLNKCFPNLKIGGPALSGDEKWGDDFLQYMTSHNVGIDFYSWHCYSVDPGEVAAKAGRMRAMMDKYGLGKDVESILNEWNYNKGWTDEYQYSVEVINNMKGAAFTAATLAACQDAPVDMLMYYDARTETVFNGMFDNIDFSPKGSYYALYLWSKMRKLGTEVESSSDESDIYTCAATNGNGRTGILVARYNEDNNVVTPKTVDVKVKDINENAEVYGYITDSARDFTEIPLRVENGVIRIMLQPNSFIYIQTEQEKCNR